MNKIVLDRICAPKKKVRIQITFKDVKSYKANAERLKEIANKESASMAVKMV